jgi:hypothetical protein
MVEDGEESSKNQKAANEAVIFFLFHIYIIVRISRMA